MIARKVFDVSRVEFEFSVDERHAVFDFIVENGYRLLSCSPLALSDSYFDTRTFVAIAERVEREVVTENGPLST